MQNLNYHHLFYFWTVCQEGGFTKAAKKLRLSQSAISEQVSRLEEALGHKLLERTTRKFDLTEMGVIVLGYSETIFSTGQELLSFVQNRPETNRHIIRIGALGSLSRNLQAQLLLPLLDKNNVQFSVVVGDFKRLTRLLKDHALDTILTTSMPDEDGQDELHAHLLTESPVCMVATRGQRLRNLSLSEVLHDQKVFLPSRAMESRAEIDHYLSRHKITINLVGEIDDVALLRALAIKGKGVVVVPKIGVAQDLEDETLVVLYEFKNIKQRYYAMTRQKKFPNPVIESLINQFSL